MLASLNTNLVLKFFLYFAILCISTSYAKADLLDFAKNQVDFNYEQNANNNLSNNKETEAETEEEDFDFEEEDESYKNTPRYDPLEGYNIFMTNFNDRAYTYVFHPIINGYTYVMPISLRKGINNIFEILFYPTRLANHLLQLKFKEAGTQTIRVFINLTLGIGLFDVASYFDFNRHNEDFGQTLAYWGVGSGFPIVLPFLGSSNLRDIFSKGVDGYASTPYSVEPKYSLLASSFNYLNYSSFYAQYYNDLKKDAVGEPYYFFQNAYEQKRLADIND